MEYLGRIKSAYTKSFEIFQSNIEPCLVGGNKKRLLNFTFLCYKEYRSETLVYLIRWFLFIYFYFIFSITRNQHIYLPTHAPFTEIIAVVLNVPYMTTSYFLTFFIQSEIIISALITGNMVFNLSNNNFNTIYFNYLTSFNVVVSLYLCFWGKNWAII